MTRFVLFCYVIVISPRAVNLSMGRWCYLYPPPHQSRLDSLFFHPRTKKSSGVDRTCISKRAHFLPAPYPFSTLLLYSSRIFVTLNLSSIRSTVRKGLKLLKFVHWSRQSKSSLMFLTKKRLTSNEIYDPIEAPFQKQMKARLLSKIKRLSTHCL